MRKGKLRKGQGRKCRRSGINGLGKISGSKMTDRGLKKRQTKNNVVQGTPEGRKCEKRRRTRPECNSGIRDRGAKQHLRLKRRKTFYDAIERLWVRRLPRE
jgi:hypothetical protein